MNIHWTLLAGFLYAEMGFLTLLLLPFISPRGWNRVFKSNFCQAMKKQANVYFTVCIIVLILLFLDSIREMRRHGEGGQMATVHKDDGFKLQHDVQMFIAERNLYVTGLALFFWLILRRLLILISRQATLLDQSEASLKQANRDTETAEKLLRELEAKNEQTVDNEGSSQLNGQEQQVERLKRKLAIAKEEGIHSIEDLEVVKLQAESVNREFMELVEKYAKLQAEMEKTADQSQCEKDI